MHLWNKGVAGMHVIPPSSGHDQEQQILNLRHSSRSERGHERYDQSNKLHKDRLAGVSQSQVLMLRET